MIMGELLQQTLDLYAEPWKKDHDEVMRKYKAADGMAEVMRFGAFLFEGLLRKLDQDGTATVQQVEPALAAFLRWHRATSHVLSKAEGLESEEYPVEGCEELTNQLREYHAQAGPIIEELSDAKRAIDSVKSGKAISLDNYIAELQTPVHR
jgi:hypothetical protein